MSTEPTFKSQAEYDAHLERERAALERRFNVIKSFRDLRGWDIIELVRHKPGAVKFFATRGTEFQRGFAKDSIFQHLQLPS